MLISVGAATTVLCTNIIFLSLIIQFLKFKHCNFNIKHYLFDENVKSDTKPTTKNHSIERTENALWNTVFSVFISVLLFTINLKSPCLEQTLPLLVAARLLYTLSFLLGRQPYRFVFASIIIFCNCYLIYYNLVFGTDLQIALSCLLLKVQLMVPIVAFLRYLTKTPDLAIAEDAKFLKLEKPPSERDPLVERAVELQKNDMYSVLVFIAIVKMTQDAGIGGHTRNFTLLMLTRYFLFARIGHTLSALFAMPKLVTCMFYLCGIAIQGTVLV